MAPAAVLTGCSGPGEPQAVSTVRVASSTGVAADLAPTSTGPTSTAGAPGVTGAAGVPGLLDPDPFCAAWAAYGGTLQAVGLAGAFGGATEDEVARLELIAAPALVDAVTGIGTQWPTELLLERTPVLSNLIGPYGRRAQKAVQALERAGASEAQLSELTDLWRAALRSRRVDDPTVQLPSLGDELQAIVATATAEFASQATPFAKDPSLLVGGVETPLTTSYLATHCPDVASSGIGDRM